MVSNNKLKRMGRRRFIKTAATLGVSASSLQHISRDVIGGTVEDFEKEVPYVSRYRHTNHEAVKEGNQAEREPVWDSIPRRLWKRIEAAHDAKSNLLNTVSRQLSSSPLITVGVSSRSDQYEKQIEVKYNMLKKEGEDDWQTPAVEFSALEKFTPGKAPGKVEWSDGKFQQEIPVKVQKQRLVQEDCGEFYDTDYEDNIPGGVDITGGTIATPATKDSTGEQVMASAGHVVSDNDNATQPAYDHLSSFGEGPSNETNLKDYGYFYPVGGTNLQWELGDQGGGTKTADIYGVVSKERLKNKEGDTDYVLSKQGNTTGYEEGYITEYKEDSAGVRNVQTSAVSYSGDSGGPNYNRVTNPNLGVDEIYISHVHAYSYGSSTCPADGPSGNTMEYFEKQLGITV